MIFAIALVIAVLWLGAVICCCQDKYPWESEQAWKTRRREELRRKLTT